jgi:hypothetical protein
MIGLMIGLGFVIGLIAFDLAAWRWGVDSSEATAGPCWEWQRGERDDN